MTANKITLYLISILPAITQDQAQKTQENNKQTSFVVGCVTDSKTKEPIPHVEIFISGTTSGCI